jgi:hypothetical protein
MVSIKKIKPSESKFGASFDGKGHTDFYQILYNDEDAGELEFDDDKNEILSIYVDGSFREKGIAVNAIYQLFDIYDIDKIYAWSAKTSLRFWKKISTERLNNDYFVIKKDNLKQWIH